LVAVLASIALLYVIAPFAQGVSGLQGDDGLSSVGADGSVSVAPSGPAARAGITNGDRIIIPAPFADRLKYHTDSPVAGVPEHLNLERNGRVRSYDIIPLKSQWPLSATLNSAVLLIVALTYVAVGVFLVLRAPSAVTWAFFLVALSTATFSVDFTWILSYFPWFAIIVHRIWVAGAAVAGMYGLAVVASRFPNERPARLGILYERSLLVAGIALGCLIIWRRLYVEPFYGTAAAESYAPYLYGINFGAAVLCALFFLVRMLRTTGGIRKRLQWVIFGFAVFGSIKLLYSLPTLNLALTAYAVLNFFLITLPVSMAYAVLRHRVIDVRIVVGRSLVYGALTFVLIVLFVLLEVGLDRWVAGAHVVFVLELVAILAVAFGIRILHNRIEYLANALFYRDRLAARERLAKAVVALQHAESREAIENLLVAEPVDALQLSSAAMFFRNEHRFKCKRSVGWYNDAVQEILDSDALIRRLNVQWGAVDISAMRWAHAGVPAGEAAPLLAQPILTQAGVIAVALYGGRLTGDALIPEELRCLNALAIAAAASYDYIRIKELEVESRQLREQNRFLQSQLERRTRPEA
jgi:hypothetical protein